MADYVFVRTESGEEYYVPASKVPEYTKKHVVKEITIPGAGSRGGAKRITAGKEEKLVVPEAPPEASYSVRSPAGVEHKVPAETEVYGYVKDAEGKIHYTKAKIGTETIAGAKFHPVGIASMEVTPFGIRPKGWTFEEEAKELQHGKILPVGRPVEKPDIRAEDIRKERFKIPEAKYPIDRSVTTPEIRKQMEMERKEKELAELWYKYHGKPVEEVKIYGRPEATFIIKTAEQAGFTQVSALILSPELRKKTVEYISKYPERTILKSIQSVIATPYEMTKEFGKSIAEGDIASAAAIPAGVVYQLAVFHKIGELGARGVNLMKKRMPVVREVTIDITDVKGINIMRTSIPEEKTVGIGVFRTGEKIKGFVRTFIKRGKGGKITIDTKLTIPEQKIGRIQIKPYEKIYYGKVLKSTPKSSIVVYSESAEDLLKFKPAGTDIKITKTGFEIEKRFKLVEVKRTLTGEERILGFGKRDFEIRYGDIRITKTKGGTIRAIRKLPGRYDLTRQEWINIEKLDIRGPDIKAYRPEKGLMSGKRIKMETTDIIPDREIKLKVKGPKGEVEKFFGRTSAEPKSSILNLMFTGIASVASRVGLSTKTKSGLKYSVRPRQLNVPALMEKQLPLQRQKKGIDISARYDTIVKQVQLQDQAVSTKTATKTLLMETNIPVVPTIPEIKPASGVIPFIPNLGAKVGMPSIGRKKYGLKIIKNPLPKIEKLL